MLDERGGVDGIGDPNGTRERGGAGRYEVAGDGRSVLRIDCAECDHRHTAVCDDCLVTFLCEREDDGAVVVPLSEIRAVRMLQDAGLAPAIRHRSSQVS